jgi:CRISPR-associated protein Csm1
MSDMVLKIALAGLLHDVGKFMQRAEVPLSSGARNMEGTICPVYQGRYSHKHVLWTSEFFELFSSHPHLGMTREQDSIANMAAFHHNPATKLQEIIRLADRLSSGSDRHEDEESHSDRDWYKKARLHSIFDYLGLEEKKNETAAYRYELDPLDDDCENCFPTHQKNLNPKEGEKVVAGYGELWENFRRELDGITTRDADGFGVALLSLLEKYTWCIPSSTMDRPDISLFDHVRTTAAIAAALYRHHADRNDLATAHLSVNDATPKFRLLAGDLSSIQNYIFNIRNVGVGGTAKRLRARSFYLSTLAESASHVLLHTFELPLTNLVIASGGKFYLLLPNTDNAEEVIARMEREFAGWLIKNLNGEIALNIASVAFSCKEMLDFNQVLKRVNDALQEVKERAFAATLIDGNGWREEAFLLADRAFTDDEHLCPSCRKFPGSHKKEEGITLCDHCAADIDLGADLSRAVGVQFFRNGSGNQKRYGLFAGYSFSIPKKREEFSKDAYLVQQFNNWESGATTVALRPRSFANYVPRFEEETCRYCQATSCGEKEDARTGNPRFFACLAEASRGKRALGVFKADVDNLGLIFINGFRSEREKCISRIITLSRMLDSFFTGRLDYLLHAEFPDIYTVYSGGDDLLMLGPWEQILRFSKRVRDEFRQYTCGNPAFTLSAGIALSRPRLPVYAAIAAADSLLDKAKQQPAIGAERPKDQLAALGDVIKWGDLEAVQGEADRLAAWQADKKLSMGFVRQLLDSAEQYRQFKATGETSRLRFVSMLAYAISRNIPAGEAEIIAWAADCTDLTKTRLNNLTYMANYAIQTNRS